MDANAIGKSARHTYCSQLENGLGGELVATLPDGPRCASRRNVKEGRMLYEYFPTGNTYDVDMAYTEQSVCATTALSRMHRSKESLAYARARRVVPALVSAAEAHFGSWGKALYAAGIDPNLYIVHHKWRNRRAVKDNRQYCSFRAAPLSGAQL